MKRTTRGFKCNGAFEELKTDDDSTGSEEEYEENGSYENRITELYIFSEKNKFIGWNKHVSLQTAMQTRNQKVVKQMPRVKGISKQKMECPEMWSLVFTAGLF